MKKVKTTIVIYIYDGITMLDAIGPYEILRHVKGVNIKFVSKEKDVIKLSEKIMESNAKKDLSLWEILKNARMLIKLKNKTNN